MNFKKWLESYKDLDSDQEQKKIQNINMTASLPLFKSNPLNHMGQLTRGFHLNTIIGRMMSPWATGLKWAPKRWRISEENKAANNAYKAAYELFKQELANAVDSLPYKTGMNIHTGTPEDVMAKSKEFFKDYLPENKNLIQSMNNAWKIYTDVFGDDNQENYSQIQNFLNFYQIVEQEFLTIGEMLPTLDDAGFEASFTTNSSTSQIPNIGHEPAREKQHEIETWLVRDIQKEIDKYYTMLR